MIFRLLTFYLYFLLLKADDLLKLSPGDYDNWLFTDNQTSVQVIITSPQSSPSIQSRFIVALPAGNSGALAYFLPIGNATRPKVLLDEGSLKSVVESDSTGITGRFTLDSTVTVPLPVMGSIRAIRDYTEGDLHFVHPEMIVKPMLLSFAIVYDYPFLDGSGHMTFTLSTNQSISLSSNGNETTLSAGVYDFKVLLNLPSLKPLSVAQLIRDDQKDILNDKDTAYAIRSLAFLTYEEKFLAGGWHFLTYFGRDTLISTRLLIPILSSNAVEAAMGAVFDRINPSTGELSHEETIGDYAAWIHKMNNQTNLHDDIQDYKMMDTNFQLLPLLATYFLDEQAIGANRSEPFLARVQSSSSMTFRQLLTKNVDFVMAKAKQFSDNPIYSNLVQIKDTENVGNWRDSDAGLGGGRYPYDINVAMVPSCLRAIERLANAGILPSDLYSPAEGYRKIWEDKAMGYFTFQPVKPDDSLRGYLDYLKLPASLYKTGDVLPKNIHALSLKSDGTPVKVMHSDISFNLMYHDQLNQDFISYVIDALRPYPRGLLMDQVGLLVANPAYDSANDYKDQTNWKTFDRFAYHGAVVWGFQQSMLVMGIDRQLKLCLSNKKPDWCDVGNLQRDLLKAECRIWSIINQDRDAEFSETWSWDYDQDKGTFVIKTPSELSTQTMESDAVQLWSFSLLAAIQPNCDVLETTTEAPITQNDQTDSSPIITTTTVNPTTSLSQSNVFSSLLSAFCVLLVIY